MGLGQHGTRDGMEQTLEETVWPLGGWFIHQRVVQFQFFHRCSLRKAGLQGMDLVTACKEAQDVSLVGFLSLAGAWFSHVVTVSTRLESYLRRCCHSNTESDDPVRVLRLTRKDFVIHSLPWTGHYSIKTVTEQNCYGSHNCWCLLHPLGDNSWGKTLLSHPSHIK